MNKKLTVQEALKIVKDSHIQKVSDLQIARTLLGFVLSSAEHQGFNLGKNMIEQITKFLEKTK